MLIARDDSRSTSLTSSSLWVPVLPAMRPSDFWLEAFEIISFLAVIDVAEQSFVERLHLSFFVRSQLGWWKENLLLGFNRGWGRCGWLGKV